MRKLGSSCVDVLGRSLERVTCSWQEVLLQNVITGKQKKKKKNQKKKTIQQDN